MQQYLVEAIEQWHLEREAGHDVPASERKHAAGSLVRMERRVIVDAIGISFQDLPHICWKVALISGVDRFPYAEKADQVVADGCLRPLDRGELATDGERHLLDSGEIILGVGEAEAESDIDVPGANDVRHAEGVTGDSNGIPPGFCDQAGRIGRRRRGEPIGHDQECSGTEYYPDE